MEISSKLSMDEKTRRKLYKNDVIHPLMNLIISNITTYLYSDVFIQYMFKYTLNKTLLNNQTYLQKNIYSFHMKGSTTFMKLLPIYDKTSYECYSDYDFSLVLNPLLFSQPEYAHLRTLLILGLLKDLSIICNDLSNNSIIIEKCKKLGIVFDDPVNTQTFEVVNTGISSDDLTLMKYYFNSCNNSLHNQFDLRSLLNVKILTNINNEYTSHMLISVALKGKIVGEDGTYNDIHLIDIVIPTYNSPSISYEWFLSTNKLYVHLPELTYVSQNETYKMYVCTNVYNYFILDLQSFYIDQLYASHFTKFIKDGKTVEKMTSDVLMDKKYTKRFKRALYIQIFVMSEVQLIGMILKYGKLDLPNKKKLVDLIVEVPYFNRILDA